MHRNGERLIAVRPVIDAGPALNFFSINKQRLLIGVLGPLSTRETVQKEVFRKAQQEHDRFGHAVQVWNKLGTYLQVLSDDLSVELAQAVMDVAGTPMTDRMKTSKDLGEIMVISHALVAAMSGKHVTVLIDDAEGRQLASIQRSRLARLRLAGNQQVGQIMLIGSISVLKLAAQSGKIRDRGEMRDIYARLRQLDTGLPPIEASGVLQSELWKHRKS